MSEFNAEAMLKRIEQEEGDFQAQKGYPPRIDELSEPLRQEIEEHILYAVRQMGMETLKRFLEAF